MRVAAVVVAAGKGTRFGSQGPKALELLAGEPLLVHAVRAMSVSPMIDRVVVVAPADRIDAFDAILRTAGERSGVGAEADVVGGGRTRQESVALGLGHVLETFGSARESDCVLIHDAARPLVPGAVIRRVVNALAAGHPAVVPALPVADTIKRVERVAEGEADADLERVVETYDRTLLRAMQTPQGFHLETIVRAHENFAERGETEASAAPDDAALIERAGIPVVLVRGSERSMKITRPLDLAIAQMLADDPSLGT